MTIVRRALYAVALVWPAVLAGPAPAHPDLEAQIAALTGEIARAPRDAMLYLRRGTLYRRHASWDCAFADFTTALELDPALAEARYQAGLAWLERARPRRALASLARYLAERPGDPEALVARARALAALGRPLAAASDLDLAIDRLDPVLPDHYLLRARLLAVAGREHVDRALAGLESGVERLGALAPLIDEAIALEAGRDRQQAALAWLGRLPEALRRHPASLLRAGDLLAAAGRSEQARVAYREALATIDALPQRQRNTVAVAEVETDLRDRLAAPRDGGR